MNNLATFLDFVGVLINKFYMRGCVPEGDSNFLDELRALVAQRDDVERLVDAATGVYAKFEETEWGELPEMPFLFSSLAALRAKRGR